MGVGAESSAMTTVVLVNCAIPSRQSPLPRSLFSSGGPVGKVGHNGKLVYFNPRGTLWVHIPVVLINRFQPIFLAVHRYIRRAYIARVLL